MTRLRNALAIAHDEPFLQLLWCVHALQTGRADRAARGIVFPREAADPAPGSPYAIHAWELETLLGLFHKKLEMEISSTYEVLARARGNPLRVQATAG